MALLLNLKKAMPRKWSFFLPAVDPPFLTPKHRKEHGTWQSNPQILSKSWCPKLCFSHLCRHSCHLLKLLNRWELLDVAIPNNYWQVGGFSRMPHCIDVTKTWGHLLPVGLSPVGLKDIPLVVLTGNCQGDDSSFCKPPSFPLVGAHSDWGAGFHNCLSANVLPAPKVLLPNQLQMSLRFPRWGWVLYSGDGETYRLEWLQAFGLLKPPEWNRNPNNTPSERPLHLVQLAVILCLLISCVNPCKKPEQWYRCVHPHP